MILLLSIFLQLQGLLNLSGASTASTTNYLHIKKGYVMSYNGNEGRANWIAWTLKASDVGEVPRSNDFREDRELPASFVKADGNDYKGSGYDRGHLCPSEDRTSSVYLNQETFLMSNMLPQTPELNRGPWKYLEAYCRKLAKRGQTLSIYAGGIGSIDRLANGSVRVPAYCWKVVKTNDKTWYLLFPNVHQLHPNWQMYAVSKEELEQKTKLKFN